MPQEVQWPRGEEGGGEEQTKSDESVKLAIPLFPSLICLCICRFVTVIRIVTVMRAGHLLTADTLEPEAVWIAALLESQEVLITHTHTLTCNFKQNIWTR